jgi:hypothetical protein
MLVMLTVLLSWQSVPQPWLLLPTQVVLTCVMVCSLTGMWSSALLLSWFLAAQQFWSSAQLLSH